jgi:thymidylate synthase (FAD)
MRHRASWQELSRRYVSGKRLPFEFYQSPKLAEVVSTFTFTTPDGHHITVNLTTDQLQQACLNHYDSALASSVKPEEARRCIPQSMMTTVYSAWLPNQLDNFFKLRLDKHAQTEINELAVAMNSLSQN